MYAAYWNLKGNPFLNVVDPRFLYSVDQYEEAIARFVFLAESGRLGGVLTGPYGVGKSTVLKHVAAAIESRHRLPLIRMDAIPGGQLPMARHILADMKIGGPTATLADTLMNFGHATEHGNASLTRTLLCIDEAHTLAGDDGLYLIHYLNNLRIPDRRTQSETPLFTIILAGSPALLPAIQAQPSLSQRMQIVFRLAPFPANTPPPTFSTTCAPLAEISGSSTRAPSTPCTASPKDCPARSTCCATRRSCWALPPRPIRSPRPSSGRRRRTPDWPMPRLPPPKR